MFLNIISKLINLVCIQNNINYSLHTEFIFIQNTFNAVRLIIKKNIYIYKKKIQFIIVHIVI